MDSREHAGSSSSPSDKITILEAVDASGDAPDIDGVHARASRRRGAERGGAKAARTEVRLSDGSSFFVRSSLWVEAGLSEGCEVEPSQLVELEARSDSADAYDHAVRLLARREHARAELARKLEVRGYSREAGEHALDRLESLGYLDDRRFATLFIEQRLKKRPEAPAALRARLLDRGVDEGVIREAIESVEAESPELIQNAVHAAAAKIARGSNITDDKIFRSLARRGFRTGEILAALKALGRSGENLSKKRDLS
jgi:regulatory protein